MLQLISFLMPILLTFFTLLGCSGSRKTSDRPQTLTVTQKSSAPGESASPPPDSEECLLSSKIEKPKPKPTEQEEHLVDAIAISEEPRTSKKAESPKTQPQQKMETAMSSLKNKATEPASVTKTASITVIGHKHAPTKPTTFLAPPKRSMEHQQPSKPRSTELPSQPQTQPSPDLKKATSRNRLKHGEVNENSDDTIMDAPSIKKRADSNSEKTPKSVNKTKDGKQVVSNND